MATKTQDRDDTHLTRYLLGELSERERERMEESYFADEAAFEELLAAEDELIDAYARGELSAEERLRFENGFLSTPRGRERVQFARAFTAAVSGEHSTERRDPVPALSAPSFFSALWAWGAAQRVAVAAVALFVVAGFVWLLVERGRMNGELQQARDERTAPGEKVQPLERVTATPEGVTATPELARNTETPAPIEDAANRTAAGAPPMKDALPPTRPTPEQAASKRAPRTPSVVSFVLTPGLTRSGGGTTLSVARDARTVSLRLTVEADSYESYRAVIETAEEQEVWRGEAERPKGASRPDGVIALTPLPAATLPSGDYVLRLSGKQPGGAFEPVADYSFRVVRK